MGKRAEKMQDETLHQRILSDVEGRTAIDWGIYGAPETFLVDAAGVVRWKHVGPLTDAIVDDELMPLVRDLEAKR